MDLIPLRGCYLTEQDLITIVTAVGNRPDRKRVGNSWKLVWGLPPKYSFMNRPLDPEIMQSDNAQAIASYISEQVVLFRKDIEKRVLRSEGKIQPNITLTIKLNIYRGSRAETCADINYPLSGRNPISRP